MELLNACITAFVVVFVLLSLFALAKVAITVLFPVRKEGTDPALAAAITSTVATLIPGARVTRIEEER